MVLRHVIFLLIFGRKDEKNYSGFFYFFVQQNYSGIICELSFISSV